MEALPSIPGYTEISRRDRDNSSGYGGIAVLARANLSNIVFLKHSDMAERSWHACHTDAGVFFSAIGIVHQAPIIRQSAVLMKSSEI